VVRDSVEPFRSSKFSVSSLKREPGLNLETRDSLPAREDTRPTEACLASGNWRLGTPDPAREDTRPTEAGAWHLETGDWEFLIRLVRTLAPPKRVWHLETGDWELPIRLVRTLAPPKRGVWNLETGDWELPIRRPMAG
jgi:hypothetical protein